MWHISQGEAAQVYVGVCERQILLTTCVRKNTNKCDCVCVCVFLPVVRLMVGLRP